MPTDPRQRHRQSRVTEENLRQCCIPRASGPFRMLVGHLADVLEIGKFPIAQDGCPNHLAHSATIIGMGDSEPCHRGAQVQLLITGRRHRLHSLVVLDPVTNPLIVECLRGFIHDELQAHLLAPVASNDVDKSGSTPALLPKALAMLAHIAASGDTLLFANDFPRGDGTQDQSTHRRWQTLHPPRTSHLAPM